MKVIPIWSVTTKIYLLPSQKVDSESISHLTQKQQTELLEVLDCYPECFSDIPGYVDVTLNQTGHGSSPLVCVLKGKEMVVMVFTDCKTTPWHQMSSMVIQVTVYFDHMSLFSITECDSECKLTDYRIIVEFAKI